MNRERAQQIFEEIQRLKRNISEEENDFHKRILKKKIEWREQEIRAILMGEEQ